MATTLRSIPGFENYFLDETGRVFSTRTGELKEMPARTDELGNKRVSLCQGKKVRTLWVSSLIELSQQNLGWRVRDFGVVKSKKELYSQKNNLVLEVMKNKKLKD